MHENDRFKVEFDDKKPGEHYLIITQRHVIPMGVRLMQTNDGNGWSGWEYHEDGIYRVNKMHNGEVLSEKKITKEQFEREIAAHLSQAGDVLFPLPPGSY
jgi:hypothetical protein